MVHDEKAVTRGSSVGKVKTIWESKGRSEKMGWYCLVWPWG